MQQEIDRLIRTLTEELKEENLALFCGAGLSVAAGYVDWIQLLKPIAEELNLDIEKEKSDLVSLAQYHCNANLTNRSKLNQLLIKYIVSELRKANNCLNLDINTEGCAYPVDIVVEIRRHCDTIV